MVRFRNAGYAGVDSLANLEIAVQESAAEITHDPLPTVVADSSQMVQLLQNLVDNAIKFSDPRRRLRIHISAERVGAEWIFSVRDNGIGISPEHHERIFVNIRGPALAWRYVRRSLSGMAGGFGWSRNGEKVQHSISRFQYK